MKVDLTCTYCDYKWEKTLLALNNSTPTCPRCGDKKIKARQHQDSDKIDYYQGSPAFIEKMDPYTHIGTDWGFADSAAFFTVDPGKWSNPT